MKRTNIELLIGWLDALRLDDREKLLAALEPEVVWQGIKPDWVCRGREEVVDVFTRQRDAALEVDSLELIGGEGHVILHAHGGGVLEIELDDGIYNVFAISDRRVTRIDDFAERGPAFAAAGLGSG